VRVLLDAGVVRTLSLGALAAGAHSAAWDGRAGSGEYLASSRPTFTVTAVSSLGESRVTKAWWSTCTGRGCMRPAAGRPPSERRQARLQGHGPVQRQGRRQVHDHRRQGPPGSLRSSRLAPDRSAQSISWRPRASGVYTVSYRAIDRGGNREAAPARTVVTVR